MRLTLITWNIHKGIGGVDRAYRPERIIEVLRHHEPDIVLLQEVDEGARRSEFDRQVDLIAEALRLRHFCFEANHQLRMGPGHYGNAIVSRWPLHDIHNIDLTVPPKKRRGALAARTRVRRKGQTRTLALYNLHLGLAGFERAIQLKRFFQSHPFSWIHHRTPAVVAGDLNDMWGTLGRKFLEPQGLRRAGRIANTYPAVYPVRPLDGVFLRGDVRSHRCAVSRLGLAAEASDHRPMVVELELLPPA